MKYRVFTGFMIAILLLSGCSTAAAGSRLANGQERAVMGGTAGNETIPTTIGTDPTAITREEAERIALEHAGFTADQVNRLRTEYEVDDGAPRYEVQFRQGRWEYDYEIHAQTGAILSYDRDD